MNMSRLSLGVFGTLLALFFFINNLGYPSRAAQIPLIFASAVGLLSLAWIIQELMLAKRAPKVAVPVGGPASAQPPRSYHQYVKAFSIYVVALVYVYSIGVVGYFIASLLFMGISLLIVREVGVRYAAIGSLALLGTIGVVFFYFLGLNMPTLPTF